MTKQQDTIQRSDCIPSGKLSTRSFSGHGDLFLCYAIISIIKNANCENYGESNVQSIFKALSAILYANISLRKKVVDYNPMAITFFMSVILRLYISLISSYLLCMYTHRILWVLVVFLYSSYIVDVLIRSPFPSQLYSSFCRIVLVVRSRTLLYGINLFRSKLL